MTTVPTLHIEDRSASGVTSPEVWIRGEMDREWAVELFDNLVHADSLTEGRFTPWTGHRLMLLADKPGRLHPDNSDRPVDNNYYRGWQYALFFRRDLMTEAPLHIVVWRIWQGGFREVRRWEWTVEGLVAAGAWAVENRAFWKEEGGVVGPRVQSAEQVVERGSWLMRAGAR